MNSRIWTKVAAATLACAMSMSAQTPSMAPAAANSQSNVALIYTNRAKPGMIKQYEQGRKKHMAWHRSQKDPWTWVVWEIMTGDNTGSYIIGTFNHAWKDLDGRDKFEADDSVEAASSMSPSEEVSKLSYYYYRRDMSATALDQGPTPYSSVTIFTVKPEGVADFVASVKKINEGALKTNYGSHAMWYSLASGGQGPQFVVVQSRENFAAIQGPEKSTDVMMKEAYGDEGTAVMKTFRSSYTSTYSQLQKYRPDLSYTPAVK